MRTIITKALALLAMAVVAAGGAAAGSGDAEAIAAMLRSTFERPDAPLDVQPVAVSGDFAVADWTQGEAGGRALAERRSDVWAVVACGGDALREAAKLEAMGVPAADAAAIATALNAMEASVDPDRLARMAAFGDTITMGEGGHDGH